MSEESDRAWQRAWVCVDQGAIRLHLCAVRLSVRRSVGPALNTWREHPGQQGTGTKGDTFDLISLSRKSELVSWKFPEPRRRNATRCKAVEQRIRIERPII